MKRMVLFLLSLCLLLLCACGTVPPRQEQIPAAEPIPETSPAPVETETPGPAETEAPAPAVLRLQWAEELAELPEHESFVAAQGEWAVQILIETDRPVGDFRVLALTPEDGAEGLRFREEALFTLPELRPERPLLLTLVFYGDIPNNGFSYVDTDGSLRRCALGLSGEDGSLQFWEYDE
jgi:hypothetical protein